MIFGGTNTPRALDIQLRVGWENALPQAQAIKYAAYLEND